MKHKLDNSKYLNAPTLAYYAINGTIKQIRGRAAAHDDREICGSTECAEIDNRIPENSMKRLLSMEDIDMRSSCQGLNDEYGPFFIFRVYNKNENYINSLCDKLNDNNTICKYGLGQEDNFRIIVVAHPRVNNMNLKSYDSWWVNIVDKLNHSM